MPPRPYSEILRELKAISNGDVPAIDPATGNPIRDQNGNPVTLPGRKMDLALSELLMLSALAIYQFDTAHPTNPQRIGQLRNAFLADPNYSNAKDLLKEFGIDSAALLGTAPQGQNAILNYDNLADPSSRVALATIRKSALLGGANGGGYSGPTCRYILELMIELGKAIDAQQIP